MPTRRLLLLFLLTAPVAALGPLGRSMAFLLALLLVIAAAVDWLLARDVRRVSITRELEDKLSLAEWNPVMLVIENGNARPLRATVRDVTPPDFEVTENTEVAGVAGVATGAGVAGAAGLTGSETLPAVTSTGRDVRLPANGTVRLTYRVRPRHRGNHAYGSLYLRAVGPLGLVARRRAIPNTATGVRVYPSLRGLRRYELQVKRGLAQEAGSKAIRIPGASTEFERLREYVPDDEFRRINWKATARRGRPVVNEYQTERSQNVVLMLDAGRLMGARAALPGTDEADALVSGEISAGLTKLDYVVNSAMLLAYVAGLRGDRVSLLAYGDTVRAFTPPTRGRRAFLRVVDQLYALAPEPVEPDHALAFQFLAARNLRRSLVVLFTDLADRESSSVLVANLLRSARQHLVVCVTLADPTVTRPAASVPENPQALYEKMVAQRLVDERAAVLATLSQRGVYSLDTDANKLSPSLIDAYLELKQRGRI